MDISEDKLAPFSVCAILGVRSALKDAKLGAAQVRTEFEELTAEITKVLEAGGQDIVTPEWRESERQTPVCQRATFWQIPETKPQRLRKARHFTVGALKLPRAGLTANEPRRISGKLSDRVRLYVDASQNPDGFWGIGGICANSSGKILGFCLEEVPQKFLEVINQGRRERDGHHGA